MTTAVLIVLVVLGLAALIGLPVLFALDNRLVLKQPWADWLFAGFVVAGIAALMSWTLLGITGLALVGG